MSCNKPFYGTTPERCTRPITRQYQARLLHITLSPRRSSKVRTCNSGMTEKASSPMGSVQSMYEYVSGQIKGVRRECQQQKPVVMGWGWDGDGMGPLTRDPAEQALSLFRSHGRPKPIGMLSSNLCRFCTSLEQRGRIHEK